MKICIVGAGAIGGLIGTKLAATGLHQISALARGETLAALQQHGWRLQTAAGLVQAPLYKASSHAVDLGVQDLIVIAVKSQSMAEVAPTLAPLMDERTLILPAMNGVPWWFMAEPLGSIDSGGVIGPALPKQQVIGCVVHASTSCPRPGFVEHRMGQGLIVGEPLGGESQRVAVIAQVLSDAGFDVTQSGNIRHDIWYKLWGNMSTNPITAMTGATVDRVLADPLVRQFCTALMEEAKAIGAHIGCRIEQTPEDRHATTEKLGAFKTSMLQDVEAGRSMELDAIVGAVREIGLRVNVPTPNIDALFGLTRLFGQTKNLYKKK
ncbi:MAG: 2-dehydropantoate 2-reductase [Cytophagales bacterium]|nr:2-dehydropantoate 2-reductase [Cytophagales bacterium]